MAKIMLSWTALGAVLLLSGCVTLGSRLPGADQVAQIMVGKTTQAEIESRFGTPFRTGLDSGDPTVTYLYYKFGLFSRPITEDLTVRYGADGRVKSYTFNSNQD